jgi:hypothetical protein
MPLTVDTHQQQHQKEKKLINYRTQKKNHKIHQRYENKSTYLCLKSNASDLEQMKEMRKC